MKVAFTLRSRKYGTLPFARELSDFELKCLAEFALRTLYIDQCAIEERRPNDAEFERRLTRFFEREMLLARKVQEV